MYYSLSKEVNGNLYVLSGYSLSRCLNKLWNTNFLSNLFSNYTEKATLIYSILKYPFDILKYESTQGKTFILPDNVNSAAIVDSVKTGSEDLATFSDVPYTGWSPAKINIASKPLSVFEFTSSDLSYALNHNFGDYGNFSEYKLYLPYIGYVDIDPELILFSTRIRIEYSLDISTSRCCAIILYSTTPENSSEISYTRISAHYGYMGYEIPFSGADTSAIRNSILSLVGVGIGTAGIIAGQPYLATTAVTSAAVIGSNTTRVTTRNTDTNRQITAGTTNTQSNTTTNKNTSTERYLSKNSAYASVFSGIANLTNCRIPTTVRDSSSNNDCEVTLHIPYILAKKPIITYSTGFDSVFGRPLNKYKKLKDLRGYTKVGYAHLNIPCLSNELDEIEELLHDGIILNTNAPIPDPPPEPEPTPTPTPTPAPDTPKDDDPISPNAPTLPEGEVATMLCCFNGKFKVTGMRGTPAQTGRPRNHYGLDLVGMDTPATNTPVYAISSGWVKLTDQGDNYLGKCVHVQMDNKNYYGEWILYGHLSKFEVKNGQYVEKGQLIGLMGNTGASKGWHTHLEWRNKYDKYDPDFSKYDICKFTGIPNTSVEGQNVHIGSPIYKTANGASVQSKLGLENQTIEYLENYEYADDLMKKIDEHTK